MNANPWHFWLDVGGTFTDCLAHRPDGTLLRRKVLSSAVVKGRAAVSGPDTLLDPNRTEPDGFWTGYRLRLLEKPGAIALKTTIADSWSDGRLRIGSQFAERHRGRSLQHKLSYELASPEEAPLLAIRLFLGLRLDQPIPPCVVRVGTTRGTNALLTRSGARTALVTTHGHADVLRIGYQNRPRLFDLTIVKPEPLYEAVAEIDERVAADGSVIRAPDDAQIAAALAPLRAAGIESLAICLLNAYANPAHENRVAQIAAELGFEEVSVSHRVSPLRKIVPRGDTTLVDAYLNPVLRSYIGRLSTALHGSHLRLMTSAGGLTGPDAFSGKDSILSGPAGGVVGFARAAEAAGFARAIGFDMGGTSTDVARYDGRFEHEFETEKAGVRIVAPLLAIETVAAGGGSICRFDGVKLVVGPESADADPGPACYGRGGPLTITDCNLIVGHLSTNRFPFPLDRAAAEARLAELLAQIAGRNATEGAPYSAKSLAEGFLQIANANMAQAIRKISLAKGFDPRNYVLVAFGSAGPQHAVAVARELGMRQVLVPADAGLLSAAGIGQADVVKHCTAAVYQPLDRARRDLAAWFEPLEEQLRAEMAAEGVAPGYVEIERSLEVRYAGVDAVIAIGEPDDGDWASAFAAAHERLFGYSQPERPVEVVSARAIARGASGIEQEPNAEPPREQPGETITGPALLIDAQTTIVVETGWRAERLPSGGVLLTAASAAPRSDRDADRSLAADPVRLEIFNNRFTAIATQMGITLRSTAQSVNVKERLDFSCAVFNARGDLVVNAPHIPVHLGAMSETVKHVLADNLDMQPGDVFVTNDPYRGGSHLPDVTVLTPVFGGTAARPELRFFTASRAHHAEIGGITPGSMPPFSRNLAEEGVLIRNFKLFAAGQSRLDALRHHLLASEHPSRSVESNVADIAAQVAANRQGARDLEALVEAESWSVVQAYMKFIQDAAERKTRAALAGVPQGRRQFTDHLDDGTPICVAITIHGDTATIDFSGTGPVQPGNLNANRAIVTAAVIYVLRLLIGEDIPLNQGVLAPINLVLPECLLNPPGRERAADCAAVVGGNVETSQRIVDVLLGALGLAAASQGTMNNVLFGDATFGYYETIAGGSGATAAACGAEAVHTHMTNTRLTDPEVLEARYPVRLRSFRVRRDSGGRGKNRGGDGVVREIEFLRPVTVSILSQRRGEYAPYGMAGGDSGAKGANWLVRQDGKREALGGLAQVQVEPGNVLRIETPGGGGYGPAPSASAAP